MATEPLSSHPSAPLGVVTRLHEYSPSDFPPGSAVLCRNTSPLVGLCYALLQRDVPCRILGRDIGAALAALVKKMQAKDLDELHTRLALWRSRETFRAESENRSAERIEDQYNCLRFFIGSLDAISQSIPDLLAKIDLMFSGDAAKDSNKVLLSTIHRAKGLEWPTVFLLDKHLIPSRYATQQWQLLQERNLLYTAITRSKHTLCYIQSDCWRDV